MVLPATEVYICLILTIFVYTVLCFAECGRCSREVVGKPFFDDVFTSDKGFYYGFSDSSSSYRSSDYGSEHEKAVPFDDTACHSSESLHFTSALYGFNSKAQTSRERNLERNRSGSGCVLPKKSITSNGNVSWSPDDVVFRLPDGEIVKCSLQLRELGLEELPPIVSGVDQLGISSCRGHLLSKMGTHFNFWNIEIQKSPFAEPSSPHVNISPTKLNWGQTYIYHSSVASLTLKNTCNDSVLTVYRLFSTDLQFYPFNFSEVVLGPGEATIITFAYLPSRLGYSSAELVLLTSFGGFLVEANGFAVKSPLKLRPLVGFDVSSGDCLSRKLSLSNPFDEIIDLEEVTALISVSEVSGSLFVESICRKQNLRDSNKYSFPNGDGKLSDPTVLQVKPLSNWLISPHKTQSIFEMAFLPNSKGKVLGSICLEVLRPMKGEKDMLVVPFEAYLNETESWKDTGSPLSVSVEAVGPCDANETMISISIRNHASYLLKIVEVNETVDSKKLFQIKYLEGLLLFPDTLTQVALVTYESLKVEYDSLLEMLDVSISCKVEILVNDSSIPRLEVPCLEIFGKCPLLQQESLSRIIDTDDSSSRAQSMPGVERSSLLIQALLGAEADSSHHEGWKALGTVEGPCLVDTHEILFPHVAIGERYAKSITIRNPSNQPVVVQLILNSGETIDNCKTCNHQQSLLPSSSIYNDSSRVRGSGFLFSDSAVTEAFLHPHGIGSLGPVLFHPSSRCEWKSSAFIRSNLSGLELLSLHGFGGSHSLVVLEGTEPIQRLDFNMNLPFPQNTSNIEYISSCCHKPLLKKLSAVNAGDFPVLVERIDVSGSECRLDGFVVHNCVGFSLEPGESMDLGLSYQPDFSMPLVKRELELISAAGTIIIPMQASLPVDVLSLCTQSIFWSDMKRHSWAIVLTIVLIFLLVRHTIHYQGTEMAVKSIKTEKQGIIAECKDLIVESIAEINPPSDVKEVTLSSSSPLKTLSVEKAEKVEVAAQPAGLTVKTRRKRRSNKKSALMEVSSSHSGNSTPTSPLSPVTTLSPPETCSPSLEKMQPRDSSSPEPVVSAIRVPENQNQESCSGSRKVGSRGMFMSSATFPGVMRNAPSRLAIGPNARAPGAKIHSQNAVQLEEKPRAEDDRFIYNIWDDHLSGVHLCRENGSITALSGALGNHSSNSFFLRGPRQTLMNNCQPPYVSKFCDDG